MAEIRDVMQAEAMGERGAEAVPYAPVATFLPESPEGDAEAASQGPDENWLFWKNQIQTALVNERRFRKEGQHAENLYFGPDDDAGAGDSSEAPKVNRITDETGLIHSNIEVLKPLVFSDTPTPIVQRRWRGDGKADETDLMAAEAGQRLAQWFLSTTDFDVAMERARDDWLIPGRGVARALYRAEFGTVETQNPLTGEVTQDEVKISEEIIVRGWEWRRVLFAPSHGFDQTPWLAFEIPMTRARVDKRFPDYAARFVYNQKGLNGKSRAFGDEDRENRSSISDIDRSGDVTNNPFDTATVWEIWNRETKQVIWYSPDCPNVILDKVDDPFGLEKFFPMPKPLLATTRGDSLNPRPDIAYYAERALEIDIATEKMRDLLEVISVSGLFPGTMADLVKDLLSGSNKMIPVSSWIGLMEKGGTSGIIQWLPLEPIISCLNALQNMREAAKQAMFEQSGISDIMRAQGDPRETAAAQNLKGKYAGMRLTVKQRRMAVFARDMLRIVVEMALELFDTKRLAEICALDIPGTEDERAAKLAEIEQAKAQFAQDMQDFQKLSQIAEAAQQQGLQVGPLPPPPKEPEFDKVPETSFELVHARLKQDFLRKITISIETDSTVLADEQADKEARIEFLSAFSTFVQQLTPLIATGEFDMKMVKELLLFGVRAFPKSRTLEGMISQIPDTPKDKGPPPEDVAITVANIKAKVDLEIERMRQEGDAADRAAQIAAKGADILAGAAHAHTAPSRPPERPTQ